MMRKLKPITPGELLLEEFLKPMEISQYRLAKEIGVPAQRIGDIVAGETDHYRRHRFASVSLLWPFKRLLATGASGL
jgi:hypothetical protein